MDITKIGEYIRCARNERGLSQAKLAEKMGVDEKTISKWENGKLPKLDNLVALADAIGCSPEHLLGFIREKDVNTSWIIQQIPLCETTIDALRSLKKECDWLGSGSYGSLTASLVDLVTASLILDNEDGGINSILLELLLKLFDATNVSAEYDAVRIVDGKMIWGFGETASYTSEDFLKLKRNPPDRYRMAKWEQEMCESKIADLFKDIVHRFAEYHVLYEPEYRTDGRKIRNDSKGVYDGNI